jgi:hypothetical protein
MATRPANTPLAFVEIGLVDLLMPLNKALQLVELMQHAVTCKPDYERGLGRQYTPGATPDVSIVNVRPDQLVAPISPSTSPRRQAPLRLTGD